MKFKSMSPKGYLDCKEYRPGGEFERWDNDKEPGTRYLSELCDRCGWNDGHHMVNDNCPINVIESGTPTPLRGRGRPRKEEKEEEQTYYYLDKYVFRGWSRENLHSNLTSEKCTAVIGTTRAEGSESCQVWHTGKAEGWNKDEMRTADELFSDPSFELYGGPDEE